MKLVGMRIAIAGAGVAGSYLSSTISGDHELTVFEGRNRGSLGNDCAWGTGARELKKYCGRVNLNPSDYIMHVADEIISDVFSNVDSITFDKHQFLIDLIERSDADFRFRTPTSEIEPGEFDLIVDATGCKRAVLGDDGTAWKVPCFQVEVRSEDLPRSIFIELKRIGYLWSFPLGDSTYRVGCGVIDGDGRGHTKGFLEDKRHEIISYCGGVVRISSPHHSRVTGEVDGTSVVGVGESVGTVCPISGEGTGPSLRCSDLLLEALEEFTDPGSLLEEYERSVLEEFSWVRGQFDFLRSVRNGSRVNQLCKLARLDSPDYLPGRLSKTRMALRGW